MRHIPTFGSSAENGRPHIEIDDCYYYVVSERGHEMSRRSTRDVEELLEWVARDMTQELASEYECAHRRPNEDFRRQLFSKQVELLRPLSADWAAREEAAHEDILRRHPFNDAT